MQFEKFINSKDNLAKNNILLKTVLIVEAVLIVVQSFIIVNKTNSQRTVFVPPQNTYKEFWVSGDQVSQSYLENIGTFIGYNLLNITKSDAPQLLANILPLVESETYYEVKKQLQLLQDYIIQNNISRSFYIDHVEIKTSSQIIVHGSISDAIPSKIINTKKIDLIVDFRVRYGLFRIVNLQIQDK